jgi:hypothetical protein
MRNGRNDDRFSSHHWLHFDHNGGIDKCGCGFLAEPDDNGWGDSIVEHFATVLRESLSARVIQAETELAQAKHDAWQEGFDRGEQDVLDHERHGWDDSCDVENPYPAPVSGIADQKDKNDG